MSNSEVARKLHITGATVGKWRERSREFGLDGLVDAPRVGAPRQMTDQQIEDVITKTLESMPANSTHWSTRLMAEEAGLTQNAIVRIWHAFGLQPHRVENFKFSKDPQFVEKVRDIVGLYLNPPDRAIVLCVDEESQVQALNRAEPILPLAPGIPARQSHDYQRHGVTSLFAAMDVASGVTISTCYRRHQHQEFLRFLNQDNLPAALDVHLIMDNYGTHKVAKVQNWLARHTRYHVHFTPTTSWLNLVERLFAEVTERCVRRGSHTAVRMLQWSTATQNARLRVLRSWHEARTLAREPLQHVRPRLSARPRADARSCCGENAAHRSRPSGPGQATRSGCARRTTSDGLPRFTATNS